MNFILFDGRLETRYNTGVCSQIINEEHQLMVVEFGYSAESDCFVNIPLPPGVHEYWQRKDPVDGTFFTSLEKAYPNMECTTVKLIQSHRMLSLQSCEMEPQESTNADQTILSFKLPAGEHRFGPLALRFLLPYESCLWLPCVQDHGQASYVVAPKKRKPSGSWTKSSYPLGITSTCEEMANLLNPANYCWRHKGNKTPGPIVDLSGQ